MRAAASGAVDFTRADPRDPRWWRGLSLVLDDLERRDAAAILQAYAAVNLSVVSRPGADAKAALAAAGECLAGANKALFPWEKPAEKSDIKSDAARLRDAWVRNFGDPDDPATQERIRKTVAALRGDD